MGALFNNRVQDVMAERAGAIGSKVDRAVRAARRGEPGEAAGRGARGVPARGVRRYALRVPAGGGGGGGRAGRRGVREGGPARRAGGLLEAGRGGCGWGRRGGAAGGCRGRLSRVLILLGPKAPGVVRPGGLRLYVYGAGVRVCFAPSAPARPVPGGCAPRPPLSR